MAELERISASSMAGIATIALADPVTGNALGKEMVGQLTDAIRAHADDPATRVIVLVAQGETFSTGAPRDLLIRLASGELQPADILLPKVLLDCRVPIIAALEGHAVGGGFALGLAADIILLARESRYGFTFMALGFSPGMGVTRLCEHALSPAIAHELLYTSELRKGAELERAGTINYVLPKADVRRRAFEVAERIAEKPRESIEMLKRTLSLPRRRAFEETITLESLMHQITLRDPAARRRIEDSYVE